jgi:branched-chain amino acid transport system substrate-binding protein
MKQQILSSMGCRQAASGPAPRKILKPARATPSPRLQRAADRPYADEGADELRAYELAVEHLNGGGDGGMLNTFSSKVLTGTGINGKKVAFVTGDTQTKSDAARASAKSMIEKDGAIMITGGSSSGVAVAVQALCQEAGVIFMAGLTHSNDTTGKDKKANGFRHFFNSYMSGAALAPVLPRTPYGTDRKAYHLTADYNWGYTTEKVRSRSHRSLGWETVNRGVRTPLRRPTSRPTSRRFSTPAPTCWF